MRARYIIISILFIVIFFYFLLSKSSNEPQLRVDMCYNLSSVRFEMVCYAMLLRNYSYCKLAADFSSYCYDVTFPLINVSKSLCEGLDDTDAKLPCYVELAIKQNNATVCELLQDQIPINICYTRLSDYASKLNDISFCGKIIHESTKFICMASITGNINYCSNITQEFFEKGFCLAMITKNVSDCFVPTGGGEESSRITFSSCIRDVAIQTKNITMCDMIGREEDKWECKMTLSKSIDICNQESDPWRDLCKLEYIKVMSRG